MKLVLGSIVSGLVLIACDGSGAGRATPAEVARVDPAATAGVRIAWVGHAVGDRVAKVEVRTVNATMESGPGRSATIAAVDHRESTREVLAVDGGVLAKAKVHYTLQRVTDTRSGAAREKPAPLSGNTYLLWREDGDLEVTREDGQPLSPSERKVVLRDNRSVGKRDAIEEFIASVTWAVGVAAQPDPAQRTAIGELMSDDSSKLSTMSVTLQAADDVTATFALTMSLAETNDQGVTMKRETSGTAVVERATGRVRSIELAGPLAVTAGAGQLRISGTMSTKAVYTY